MDDCEIAFKEWWAKAGMHADYRYSAYCAFEAGWYACNSGLEGGV